ncbi:MAG: hypothetical protein J5I93_10165 [Pirellulaceae bacterium]|nr:hypothetical protein [Pirellulaceae bacterium]
MFENVRLLLRMAARTTAARAAPGSDPSALVQRLRIYGLDPAVENFGE